MNRLKTSQLEAIQAIHEHGGNLSHAAASLHVTPSALSHRVKNAEFNLGWPIFIRQNRKLILNRGGKRLYSAAKAILGQLDATAYDFARISQGVTQVIRIGADSYHCYHWLADLMPVFAERFPTVEIEIVASASANPLLALRDGQVDLILMATNQKHPDLNSYRLFSDELVAVVAAAHPLAKKSYIEADDLRDVTYITNSTEVEEGREHELFFQNNRICIERILTAGYTDVIVDLVRANIGVTILTRWAVAPYLETGELKTIPITAQSIQVDWHCFTSVETPISEELSMIIDWLKSNCSPM